MEKFYNILIIDDDQVTNFLFSRMVQSVGISEKAEAVTSGQQGLVLLEEKIATGEPLPQVIFLDINMPLMNGWEFLEKYNEMPSSIRSQINLYMLSSSIYPEDINKAKSHEDVVDYITKPLTREVLLKIHQEHRQKPS